ncbi:hypothetical protein [Celeribacter litoreus]|nr:hypothetical protein [Celeribacter litoreus]MCA0044574.1 hypothetical protein [Celeribacter litoreus]
MIPYLCKVLNGLRQITRGETVDAALRRNHEAALALDAVVKEMLKQ